MKFVQVHSKIKTVIFILSLSREVYSCVRAPLYANHSRSFKQLGVKWCTCQLALDWRPKVGVTIEHVSHLRPRSLRVNMWNMTHTNKTTPLQSNNTQYRTWKAWSALSCRIINKSSRSGGRHIQKQSLKIQLFITNIEYFQRLNVSFVFFLRFLLTSFLLILKKYLINLFIYLFGIFWGNHFLPTLPSRYGIYNTPLCQHLVYNM